MRRSLDKKPFDTAALVFAVMALTPAACRNNAETNEPQTEASASAEASVGKEGVKAEANTEGQSGQASTQTPPSQPTAQNEPKTQPAPDAPQVHQPKMDVVKGARIKLHQTGTFAPGANVNIAYSYGKDNALQEAYNCVATGTPDVPEAKSYGFSPVTEAEQGDLSLVARAFQYIDPNGKTVNATAVQASINNQTAYQFNVKTGDLSGAHPDLVREVGTTCKQQAETLKATLNTDGQPQ